MSVLLLHADARHLPIADGSVHCCVTSPPYWGLRDYGTTAQLGLERRPDCLGWATGKPCGACYVCDMVAVFREVRRVLRDDGTAWVNIGDSYAATTKGSSGRGEKQITNAGTILADRRWAVPAGLKPKDLVGIPWRVAFALQADGWWLRSDVIWAKPNPMPESVRDRPTKAHEYVFMLAKSARYYFDADAVSESSRRVLAAGAPAAGTYAAQSGRMDGGVHMSGGFATGDRRNIRSVWTIASQPCPDAHYAVMPQTLAERCILAGCPECGVVLDPFAGSGTVGRVAVKHRRRAILCDINAKYLREIATKRTAGVQVELGIAERAA